MIKYQTSMHSATFIIQLCGCCQVASRFFAGPVPLGWPFSSSLASAGLLLTTFDESLAV